MFRAMGEMGLMGMLVPEAYGGAGLSYYEYKLAIEEVAKVCGPVGLSMAAHNSLCTGHILQQRRTAMLVAQARLRNMDWRMGIDGGQ